MLSLCLLALAAIAQEKTDGFGRRVCGIVDVNGDGTDDLVVADAGFGGTGAMWTISGKDGSRIGTAHGPAGSSGFGSSFFVNGGEICTSLMTSQGPAAQYLSGKTLKVVRESEKVGRAEGFDFWIEPAGDIDGDGQIDAALCLVPNDLKRSFIEIVSGKTGKRIRTIEVSISRTSSVASLGDLDGDGVPELGVTTGEGSDPTQAYRAYVFSGKSGEKLGELVGSAGKAGFGAGLGAIGDRDGDGVAEIAVIDGERDAIRIYSGRSRTVLPDIVGWYCQSGCMRSGCVTTLADLNGDGVRDIGIVVDRFLYSELLIASGKNGEIFRRTEGDGLWNHNFPACISDIGDVDHDGRGDIALGISPRLACFGERGSVAVLSGATGKPLFVVDERKVIAP